MAHPEEAAFLTAYDEYADALFRHASLRVKTREEARDLVQETFLKAWDYLREGGQVRHWKSFLYRVLHNLIVDGYRKAKEESLEALLEDDVLAERIVAVDSRAEKEERLDEALMIERVRALIIRLPDPQRVAVSLRYVDGFSPKEIAELLGISENVVSVRIHRAVARLSQWCKPWISHE